MELISSIGLNRKEYLSRDRFISYHHQLRLIFSLGAEVKSILEVGIFNSLLAHILKQNGYDIKTADIDPNLNPDILLDLTADFSLPEDRFDVIVLYQVLEHLPYDQFERVLEKLAKITKKYLIISLPFNSKFLAIQVKYSYARRVRHLSLKIPKFWSKKPSCDEHYWEIGLKEYPEKRILQSVRKTGLKIKQQFTDPMHPYQYFLILEKA